MNARTKLNQIYSQAALLIAGFIVAIRMIYEDLVALDWEFEELTVSVQRTTVAVDTPIVLHDIPLGRFRIVLNWTDIAAAYPPYCVVALDPHPAAGCEAWVHPHLDSETLCAGDCRAAIARALAEGRVCGFFVIVRQILNTYCTTCESAENEAASAASAATPLTPAPHASVYTVLVEQTVVPA